ncbi:PAX-interacting protein 1 [Tribolium castaneum]|uniref:PAX-interacting protein 1 n=1 Tax=Tribolium castaneum TaxID=7070 RepID=D2A4R5_TRICA|nr:PREDICTED: PAX-interacting protein 1 [Tribolium castaneum]EFA05726.1 hypothetical protein TcasGA2_TC015410 [Tribolium castaneum]|eukprot:XP_008194489.1 PREDICTED: PAX-interacting protein 1 [Tribolium castaneum]
MAESGQNQAGADVPEDLFRGVKFFVSGEIAEKVVDLLKVGGAERLNYFSDYVTHLICGENAEENDITDATDLYEIPAVTSKWVFASARLKKLVNTKPYVYNLNKLFTNLVFCLSKVGSDREALWAVITYHGGLVQLNLTNKCTHLVTVDTNSPKYEKAANLGADKITVITPDWVVESVKNNALAQADLFHPKLIQWPKVAKHESTIAITGFEPEKVESVEKTNDMVTDSTQALLDKLKQRMPWIQPQTTTTADIVPPNVVAPSFLNKNQPNQPVRTFPQQQSPQPAVVQTNQQIPRSIVHHTPQPQQLVQQQQPPPQQFNVPNQVHLNRLIGQQQQQQQRPTLQQLRGQLAPNQLHQHLLQQRIAQQNQQNAQRPLTIQQQQLLQQQIAQRQLLQNQQQQQPQPQTQFSNVIQQQHILQQQKIFVSQQPNLAVQQQFNQNQQPQQFNQQFVQNQPDLNQPQLVQQPAQFQPNQQLLLNQQTQFNQQQQQAAQPQQQRPQINQHLWQQQQQMTIRHPVNVVQGPRIQWSPTQQPNQPQRQFIHLDAQTHNELQKMNPEQQAMFVQRLKQKQLLMQKQLTQRAGGGHILIRGSVPPGLNPQQQMQWLQRQAKQQGVVLQQQTITQPNIQQQHAPGLSPIQQQQQQQQQQQPQQFDQNQQQQLQLRQYRLQQLQLQREQAQKNQIAAVQQQPVQAGVVRPLGPVIPDSTTNPPEANSQQLVVNAKTKTALANMLSNRLQSGGGTVPVPETIPEPSAAGTLRLMTAQHNAALNPNNRPQDLIALQQQRRVINGPNGEIIRALVPQSGVPGPVIAQTEPPKVQFSPRPAVPMQHRPGPFYGHNPNLKLPPDLFLLGCIFVVVEIERYLDESLPGWKQKIEKHGGEVEKQYCNRVTHVLCETQRHGVVMQALRDCKRCITIYWLSDVMMRKQVLPPWTALHLPTIYLDTTPAAKHLITLSGFTGCERNRVKHMINYTGAKFTSYFSKHNTLLIAAKGEGAKYNHAKKWGIPVVNVQWLTDIMLGNFSALNQMEHIMYQQFPTPPNFSFDPKLVPNLMHAWKMPINISQESYERVKRSSSPVLMPKKAKKMKTEQTDENDNVDEGVEVNANYRILFSMSSETATLQKIVKQLGGIVAKSHHDCTHLVMPSLSRTNKLLFCICREVFIMPEQWLRDSHTAQKFLDEASYSLDTKEFNSEYKCDFTQTLNTRNRSKLFEGKFFWVTPSVFPSKKVLVELVQSCGGIVEKIRRTSAQIEATNINSPYSYIIITHENDIHLVADLLRNKKDKVRIVCSAELIFSAILKQTFEVEPFAVKVL